MHFVLFYEIKYGDNLKYNNLICLNQKNKSRITSKVFKKRQLRIAIGDFQVAFCLCF